jgi:Cu-Zn family superoxide dismutase
LTEGTFLNDVAVVDGDAYVTDSLHPVVYRAEDYLIAGRSSPDDPLEPWLDLTGTAVRYRDGFNLNGIAASGDGAYLLVVQTNAAKLFRIEIATRTVQAVNLGGQPLAGDGLVLAGTTLFAVANGRISTVVLTDDLSAGKVIGDFADPSFSSPTTLAKEGGCLLVVNSQFANRGGTPRLPFTVAAVPIPADLRGTLGGTPVPGGCWPAAAAGPDAGAPWRASGS